jgi:hypothetical protein
LGGKKSKAMMPNFKRQSPGYFGRHLKFFIVDRQFGPSRHGSLEAIVGRTKLSKKTKIGDGSGMVPGVPNKFQSNPVCSFPSQNFQKSVLFQRLSISRLFFDKYLAVKSHLRVLMFFVGFIDVFKTDFRSKIRTL